MKSAARISRYGFVYQDVAARAVLALLLPLQGERERRVQTDYMGDRIDRAHG